MRKKDVEQGSDEWHYARKGKITGTALKGIMGTPKARQDALYEFIAERLIVGLDDEYENPMDRGTRLEPEAVAMFEFETGKMVERVGLFEHETNHDIANSPDGMIKDTDDAEAIEIKCLNGTKHVKMWLTGKIPDEYHWQCVQYFIVNEKLQKLYFVGYHPRITMHKINIIELHRSDFEQDIKLAHAKQEVFIQEAMALLKTIIKL